MKVTQLKRTRRRERAEERRYRRLSAKSKKVIAIICAAVLLISASTFSVDLIRAKRRNLPPKFCIPVIEYSNGSEDYYGLLYKVWKDYDPFDDVTRYYVGFWFVPKSFNI